MASQAFRALAAAWPKDPLRPTVSLASALEARAQRGPSSNERAVERETVLLRQLLNSEYQKKVSICSNPSRVLHATRSRAHLSGHRRTAHTRRHPFPSLSPSLPPMALRARFSSTTTPSDLNA